MASIKFKKTEIGEIPDDWEVKEVGEIGKVKTGKTPPTKNRNFFSGKYPFIKIPDMTSELYVKNTNETLSEEGKNYMKSLMIPENSVCVSCLATIGNVGITTRDSFTNQQINSIIPNESVVPNFVYYYFKTKKWYLKNMSGGGSVYNNLSKSRFEKLKISLPSLKEQKAISKILSSLDEKIETNKKINKTLEEIGRTIFKEWFENFNFENENGEGYRESGGELVYCEELGREIPKGWEVGFLGDGGLTKFVKVGVGGFEGEKIYLATADVDGTEIRNLDTKITFDKKPLRANLQPLTNSVYFARMVDSKKLLFFDDYKKFDLDNYILSTGFCGLECLENSLYYVWHFIQGFEKTKNDLCSGSVQVAINNESVKRIKILVPSEDVLDRFNEKVKIFSEMIYNNFLEIQTLKEIRDALLPKLMSGRLRVGND